jgi:hypothetical protein
MYFSTACGLAASLAVVSAAPLQARTDFTTITFNGAAGANYQLSVPLDGSQTDTNNALSISSISASIDVPAQCTLHTVDYTPALVETSPGNWNVGPPQTVEWISCTESGPPPPPPNSITIEFDGADPDVDPNAKYILTVPLNGTPVFTNNPLSITALVSNYAALATNCVFDAVDYPPALVATSATRWQVGPPQTIISVTCTA